MTSYVGLVPKDVLNDYDKKKFNFRDLKMSEGITGPVKQAFEDKLKNPLWGFIILAWGWFNWPNLAMLLMSDAPVKFRIDYIFSQQFFYLHYVAAPVLTGCILAVVSPYAQWLLSKAHKWADDRYSDNEFEIKKRYFEDVIKLSTLKVKADRAEDLEKTKSDAEIKAEFERGERQKFKTEELEALKNTLLDDLENLKASILTQKEEILSTLEAKDKIQDLIVDSLLIIEKFLKVGDNSSIQSLKKEVENLYSTREIERSTIRNALNAERQLTVEQTMTFFDDVEQKIKEHKLKGLAEGSFQNE